jgi:hypothetical protein
MAPGDSCPASCCEGHLYQLERPNVKIYSTGQLLISAMKYERLMLRCSDCFKRCTEFVLPVRINSEPSGGVALGQYAARNSASVKTGGFTSPGMADTKPTATCHAP